MCGIVGYLGSKDAVGVIVEGLKRLEYRGYDSAGLAVGAAGALTIRRHPGKVRVLIDTLVARFGVRDLGVGRADLALTRATWQPAVLCEGLYIILPEQEAALRSPVGQDLYARGVLDGIVAFMKSVNSEK